MKNKGDEIIYKKIENSLKDQAFLSFLDVKLDYAELGKVILSVENKKEFSQYLGYMHGGMIATMLDTAGAYSVYTFTNENETVVTSELKINYLRPAISNSIFATSEVIKKGKIMSIVEAYIKDENDKLIAKMMGTMIIVPNKK